MNDKKNQEGFATILVIVFTAVLFVMLSIALEYNYQWHKQNKMQEKKLQDKADKIEMSGQKETSL